LSSQKQCGHSKNKFKEFGESCIAFPAILMYSTKFSVQKKVLTQPPKRYRVRILFVLIFQLFNNYAMHPY
jgi:hypothetical protein